MINMRNVKLFCNGDITEIENYAEAVADSETWDCHHRMEIQPDGVELTREWMRQHDIYNHVDPCMLIFMKRKDHLQLHKKGKHITERQRAARPKTLSAEHKRNIGLASKGRKMPFAGKTWKFINGKRVWLAKETV